MTFFKFIKVPDFGSDQYNILYTHTHVLIYFFIRKSFINHVTKMFYIYWNFLQLNYKVRIAKCKFSQSMGFLVTTSSYMIEFKFDLLKVKIPKSQQFYMISISDYFWTLYHIYIIYTQTKLSTYYLWQRHTDTFFNYLSLHAIYQTVAYKVGPYKLTRQPIWCLCMINKIESEGENYLNDKRKCIKFKYIYLIILFFLNSYLLHP